MIDKIEYEKFAKLLFQALSILLIIIGIIVTIIAFGWRVLTDLENSPVDSGILILGRINAVMSFLGVAFIISGLIVKFLASHISRRICKDS